MVTMSFALAFVETKMSQQAATVLRMEDVAEFRKLIQSIHQQVKDVREVVEKIRGKIHLEELCLKLLLNSLPAQK